MAARFAGILGLIAFVTMLLRGLSRGGMTVENVLAAWLALLAFAVIGYIAGHVADFVVVESVRGQLLDELAAVQAQQKSNERTTPPRS